MREREYQEPFKEERARRTSESWFARMRENLSLDRLRQSDLAAAIELFAVGHGGFYAQKAIENPSSEMIFTAVASGVLGLSAEGLRRYLEKRERGEV